VAHLRDRSRAVLLALRGGLLALPLAGCGVIPLDPPANPPPPPGGAPAATEFTPESGPFVGFSAVSSTIGGDFKGNSTLQSSNGVTSIGVPSVETGFGGRLCGGWRWEHGAVEAAFQETVHDYDNLAGQNDRAIFTSFDIDGRVYVPFFTPRLKPSIVGGFSLPNLVLHRDSTDGNTTGAARFLGYGLNLGAGTEYYVTRNLSIDVLALYHWTRFTDAKGQGSSGYHTINDPLSGDGWTLGLGAAWTF
jgi:opacity protein-like surface antigen